MHKLFLIAWIAASIACNHTSPTTTVSATDTLLNKDTAVLSSSQKQPSGFVAAIPEVVTQINTATLQKKHFAFVCDEKMAVDYFFKDQEIVKIVVDFGTVGDVYAKEEYYYSNGQLVFMYEFVEGGPACEGCTSKHEYRSYIRNNNVFRYLKDEQLAACKKCGFGASSKQYKLLKLTTAEEIKNLYCQ